MILHVDIIHFKTFKVYSKPGTLYLAQKIKLLGSKIMSGIYIHIPFCKQACYYCDFHFSTSIKRKEEMLDAIKNELIIRSNELIDPVKTIYFGGGTPSMLDTSDISEIINTIGSNYKVIDLPEITLEANPDDLDFKKIMELKDSPVNRLSIGVQSFYDEDLIFMNRAHSAVQAWESLEIASKFFDNISIDLIYGIPNLTMERWQQNLNYTFDLGMVHISSYALTVEPKTALAHFIKKGKYPPLDEALAKQHFERLQEETKKRNFIQYEISNFGLNGYFSNHNSSYWKGSSYLGIGPSAHSYDGTFRSWNISNNSKYISMIQQGALPCEKERLSVEDRVNESIMTGLRTIWGLSLLEIQKKYGLEYKNKILNHAEKHLRQEMMIHENGHLYITPKGHFLVDGISSDLFLLKE